MRTVAVRAMGRVGPGGGVGGAAMRTAPARSGVDRPGALGEAMLDLSGEPRGGRRAPPVRLGAGLKLRLIAAFARQMQVLVATGIPLAQSLQATVRQATHPGWKQVLSRLATAVDEGRPMSSAMADSGLFDAVSISLVAAGETSGNMAQMLERLADLKRRQLRLRTTIVASLAYPCMLITMGIGVMITMLVFVLPRFKDLFASLDSPLPVTTRVLLQVSDLIRAYWWAGAAGLGAAAVVIWQLLVNGAFKAVFDRYYLRIPAVGALGRSLLSARIARLLGTLLEAKVPLTESLELTRRAAVNQEFADLIARAEAAIARGQPLSSVLDDPSGRAGGAKVGGGLLVPGVQEAIRNGESSGRLGQPLVQMAEFLDEENDVALKSLTATIEPAILIVLGVVVGVIALSIFLPMFDMISAAQGGG